MSALQPRRSGGLLGGRSFGIGGGGGGGGGGASGLGPNVTPMVDVVLVILIFFMASASIAGHEWFLESMVAPDQRETSQDRDGETSLSSSASAARLPDVVVPVHLSVDERGSVQAVVLGGEATNLAGVRSAIGGLIEGAPADEVVVRLSAEPNTPYEAVVRVRELCMQLGITRVAILAGR